MSRNPRNAGLRTQTVPASCLSVSGLLNYMWSIKRTALSNLAQSKMTNQSQTIRSINPN